MVSTATDPLASIALLEWFRDDLGLVVALFAGHAIADFVLQTRAMVDAKAGSATARTRALAAHGALVALAHAAWLFPFGWTALLLAVPIAIAHASIDAFKPSIERAIGPMRAFFFDQFLHLVTLAVVFFLATSDTASFLEVPTLRQIWPHEGYYYIYIGVIASAFAFVVHGAGAIVQFTLARLSPPPPAGEPDDAADDAHRGAVIGILERLMVLGLVLVNQWAAIGLIITAKSVARFKRIEEDQAFGEIYLIGTLTSVLLAVAAGLAVRLAV